MDANDSNAVARKCTWGLDLSGLSGKNGVDGIHSADGIGGLLAIEDVNAGGGSANSYWYFYDANSNVGQLIKASDRSLAAHYEYDPYGNTIAATGPYAAANPWRFSTKWHDIALPGNVLIYYGHRYYSPRLGRWLNRDPIEERGGPSLYLFVDSSPIDLVDPLGQQTSCMRPDGIVALLEAELTLGRATICVGGKVLEYVGSVGTGTTTTIILRDPATGQRIQTVLNNATSYKVCQTASGGLFFSGGGSGVGWPSALSSVLIAVIYWCIFRARERRPKPHPLRRLVP